MTDNKDDRHVMRVAGSTDPNRLAMATSQELRKGRKVTLLGVGHSALGQALKSVPILNGIFAPMGTVYSVMPRFEKRDVEGKPCSVIVLDLLPQNL